MPVVPSLRPEPNRVVVVSADAEDARALASELGADGHAVETRASAAEAAAIVGAGGVDVLVVDVGPAAALSEAVMLLKRVAGDDLVPVVACAARGDAPARVAALLAGADEHLGRPVERRELLDAVVRQASARAAHRALVQAQAALERALGVDATTGCLSPRAIRERLEADFARAEARHEPLACAIVDVDHLKLANDAGGREAGDRILFGVAQVVQKSLRDTDSVGRYGGDELLVLLPGAHFAGASRAATRIFRDVVARLREFPGRPALSVSMGVALFPTREVRTAGELVLAAHGALDKAKRDGGAELCVLQQEGLWYTRRGDEKRPAS
jgi:diguanylate cyclase (GGDEF)-like protein